jgi:hypothetical protein
MTDDEKKEELLRELAKADSNAEHLEKDIKDIGKGLRLVRDTTKPYRRMVKLTPAGEMPLGSLDSQLNHRPAGSRWVQ